MRKRGPWSRRNDHRERELLASLVAQRFLEDAGNIELRKTGLHLRERLPERADSDVARLANERDFAGILGLPKQLHHVELRPPLPAAAFSEQSLKIAVQQVRRLESDDLETGNPAGCFPQSGPEAGGLDPHCRDIPDLITNLGVVTEIRDEMQVARGNEHQRAGAGKTGEVADVGKT